MKKLYWKILGLLAIALLLLRCYQRDLPKTEIDKEPSMRVLLVEASKKECVFGSTAGFRILDSNKERVAEKKAGDTVRIAGRDGNLFLDGQKSSVWPLYLQSSDKSFLKVNDALYRGEILCTMDQKNQFRVINVVPMEAYLLGVVGSEMPLSWPRAALEAQAIIARTFALYQKGNGKNPDFDVYDTTLSQVYGGIAKENAQIREIIETTKGIVLFYQNKIFKTFYHSTCGGHTADAFSIFQHENITPLSGHPCPYCSESPHFSWSYTAGVDAFEELLTKLKLPLPFLGMAPKTKDKGNRLLEVEIFYGNQQSFSLSASDLRGKLGSSNLKSTLFEMKGVANGILFEGKGWGHGVGLCQYGARGMGLKGFSSNEILSFYYLGSQLYRIWD